jgi:hypothetical protein
VVSLVSGVFLALFVTQLLVPALYSIGLNVTAGRAPLRERLAGILSRRRWTKVGAGPQPDLQRAPGPGLDMDSTR